MTGVEVEKLCAKLRVVIYGRPNNVAKYAFTFTYTSRYHFILQIADWFASLAECLHWNVRKKQRQFDEMSDMTRSSSNDTLDSFEKTESVET